MVTSSAFTPYHQENGGSGQVVYNVGSIQHKEQNSAINTKSGK